MLGGGAARAGIARVPVANNRRRQRSWRRNAWARRSRRRQRSSAAGGAAFLGGRRQGSLDEAPCSASSRSTAGQHVHLDLTRLILRPLEAKGGRRFPFCVSCERTYTFPSPPARYGVPVVSPGSPCPRRAARRGAPPQAVGAWRGELELCDRGSGACIYGRE
ncbi:hypothetical protein SEVIR_1G006750v4 [Setaria viridis]